jgi:hypothetical protein
LTCPTFQRLLEDDDEDDEIELPRKLPTEPELPFRAETPPQPVPAPVPPPTLRSKPKIKTLKLAEITKPLNHAARSNLMRSSIHRILSVRKM